MDLRMKCRQKCQGDPCHRMSHCRKEICAGLYLRPPPTIPFLPWSSSAFPLAFLSAFMHGLVGHSLICWNMFPTCPDASWEPWRDGFQFAPGQVGNVSQLAPWRIGNLPTCTVRNTCWNNWLVTYGSANSVSFITRRPEGEIEAENYTRRIASSRSFRKYRLEGSNP